MSSLNILQIISGTAVNGALVYCKLLSDQLTARGHKVSILHRRDSWMAKQQYERPVDLIESELSRTPAELKRIADLVHERKIDLIHTHMSRGHSFGVLLRMFHGIPCIATAHHRNLQLHWRWNDYVIANSDATLKYHRRVNLVPGPKSETVHCFTDLERFNHVTERDVRRIRRQLRLNGNEFLVGVVGEVVQRKGHIYLFRALSKIIEAVPELKLVVLGRYQRREATARALRKLLVQHGLYRRTKWLGLRSNVQDFMTAFDLTVVPSIEEPLGLVAIESLAAGTAVVATDVGGLPEIVRHEETGLLVPSKNPDAIADAVIRMARDRDLRERCGNTGRKMVFRKFDVDRLTTGVEQVYHGILDRRRAA
ncbi:MAG: glycosyltransferase family 4 protein [Planctomycetota bacterium]